MSKIITFIIEFLNRINKLIWKFIIFLSKFIKVNKIVVNNKPTDERYKQFKVDEVPLVESFVKIERKNYKELIKKHNIQPINRRNKSKIPDNIKCPCCSAPKDYLYDNTGKQTQFECKVCHHIFSNNPHKQKDVILKCPHCEHQLVLRKQRVDYDVYVCKNSQCRYYLNNLATLTLSDKKKFEENPTLFKMHYIYRKFHISLPAITKDYRDFIKQPVDLSKIYSSDYVLGLCLTYHVNYGLSYRQTAYIFFYFDAIKKIVTSYRVYEKRDSLSSIKAVYSTLFKS